MSKYITVQIKVQEYGPELYKINETGSFIRKELCTVIKTVEHVQELEQQIKDLQAKLNTYEIEESVTMKHVQPEPKGYCIKRTPENADVMNKWANKKESKQDRIVLRHPYQGSDGWFFSVCPTLSGCLIQHHCQFEGFAELFTVEDFFEKVGYKPKPQRKSLGMYEGVKIYEGDILYHIDTINIKIEEIKIGVNTDLGKLSGNGIEDWTGYTKCYLTPKEANARLKEEVIKKAKERTFTFAELEYQYDNWLTSDAIDYAIELIEKDHNITYLPE